MKWNKKKESKDSYMKISVICFLHTLLLYSFLVLIWGSYQITVFIIVTIWTPASQNIAAIAAIAANNRRQPFFNITLTS